MCVACTHCLVFVLLGPVHVRGAVRGGDCGYDVCAGDAGVEICSAGVGVGDVVCGVAIYLAAEVDSMLGDEMAVESFVGL